MHWNDWNLFGPLSEEVRTYYHNSDPSFIISIKKKGQFDITYSAEAFKYKSGGYFVPIEFGTDERAFGKDMSFEEASRHYFNVIFPKVARTKHMMVNGLGSLSGWLNSMPTEWHRVVDYNEGHNVRAYECPKYDPYLFVEMSFNEYGSYDVDVYWRSLCQWQILTTFGEDFVWEEAEKELLNSILPDWESGEISLK